MSSLSFTRRHGVAGCLALLATLGLAVGGRSAAPPALAAGRGIAVAGSPTLLRQGRTQLRVVPESELPAFTRRMAEIKQRIRGSRPDLLGRAPQRRPQWVYPEGPFVPRRRVSAPTVPAAPGTKSTRAPKVPDTGAVGIIRETSFTFPAGSLGFTPQEPTVANSGDVFFCTGNVFTGVSTNGGRNWTFVDPTTLFPTNVAGPVCCDQLVEYYPSIDRFVWLLQYQTGAGTEENGYRIAYASPSDVRRNVWTWVDFTSSQLNQTGRFLDFPDMGISGSSFAFTFNVFPNDDGAGGIGAGICRFPVASFTSGSFTYSTFTDSRFTYRLARHGLGSTRWVTTVNSSSISMYTWPEGSNDISIQNIAVASYNVSNFSTTTPSAPDGTQFNWLGSATIRILGAVEAGGKVWCAWICGRDTAAGRPFPYIRLEVINPDTGTILEERDIFNPNFAFAYPSLGVNGDGEVGVTLATGGGNVQPSMVVGMLSGTQTLQTVRTGTHGPSGNRWGDYWMTNRYYPDQRLFVCAGYTHEGSNNPTSCTTRFVVFGRQPTYHLDSPNGGEVIQAETTYPIRWSSAGSPGNMNIQLSRNNGATWETLASNTENDGEFLWDVRGPGTQGALIRVQHVSNDPPDTSDFPFTIEQPGDQYEPDQFLGEAKPLIQGETQARSIHAGNNPDLLAVQIADGNWVEITAVNFSGPGKLLMGLHAYDGNTFTQIGAAQEGDIGGPVVLRARVFTGGTFYLKIEDVGQDQAIHTYTVALNTGSGDIYEPDDNYLAASTLTSGNTQNHSFHQVGDLDWVAFELTEPRRVEAFTSGSSELDDTELFLFNDSIQAIAYDDDGAMPGRRYSRILTNTLQPGRYYLRVNEYSNDGTIENYLLTLNIIDGFKLSGRVLHNGGGFSTQVGLYTDPSASTLIRSVATNPSTGDWEATVSADSSVFVRPFKNGYRFSAGYYQVGISSDIPGLDFTADTAEPPARPTGLAGVGFADNQVLLLFQDQATSESGFQVRMARAANGPYTLVSPQAPEAPQGGLRFYMVGGLAPLTRYWFEVRAIPQESDAAGWVRVGPIKTLKAGQRLLVPKSIRIPKTGKVKVGRTATLAVKIANPLAVPIPVNVPQPARAPFGMTPGAPGFAIPAATSTRLTVTFTFTPTTASPSLQTQNIELVLLLPGADVSLPITLQGAAKP